MKAKLIDRLTPSQEAVYCFVSTSTRWLTLYEISMLTGVSIEHTAAAICQLRRKDLVLTRKRIGGFDNGEREFHHVAVRRVTNMCASAAARNHQDITGVEPLAKRLRRLLGKQKAKEYESFLK